MFSPSHLGLLSILAILLTISQANIIDANLVRRQDTSNGGGILSDIIDGVTSVLDISVSVGDSTTSPSSTPPSTSTSIPESTTTPPSSTIPSSTTTSSTPSSTPSSTIPSETSTPTSTPPSETSTPPTTSKDATSSPSQTPFTTVIAVTTVVDGSTIVSSSTATSSTSKPTNDASLNGSSPGASSGMSSSTKKTVAGVVGGIGGVIVLAALGFVAWRIWGRKKNEEYEADGLIGSSEIKMATPGSGVGGDAKFQNTLDQYHASPRNVNASSNF